MPQLVLLPRSFLILALIIPTALGQSLSDPAAAAQEADDQHLRSLMFAAKANHYDPAANREAIAILKDKFLVATDEVARLGLASSLVTLGQKDDIYWSVLATRAREIVDSSVPDPFVYDEQGHVIKPMFGENNIPIPGALAPQFLEWAKDNHKAVVDAFQEQIGEFPA